MAIKTRLATGVKHLFENVSPGKTAPCHLVYYDGGPESVVALRTACRMASASTRVVAVYMDVIPDIQDIDDNVMTDRSMANAMLAAAIVNARLYGVDIETIVVPCHAKGPALVALASEYSNATLFLGVEEREMTLRLNPFADFMIAMSPCPVVLVGREGFRNRTIAK
jgi:hypothetical protein